MGFQSAVPIKKAAGISRWKAAGFTLLEMVVTATVLLIVASAVQPMIKNTIRRQKELELRRSLREIREAIDSYKSLADQKKIKGPPVECMGYPESLEVLVEGDSLPDKPNVKIRFLRRIPMDPMTNSKEWGKRSTSDDPKSSTWGGGHVFDVYSTSGNMGSNNIPYKEW